MLFQVESDRKVQEVKNEASLKKKKPLGIFEGLQNSLIVTSTNKEKSAYNSLIREELQKRARFLKKGRDLFAWNQNPDRYRQALGPQL